MKILGITIFALLSLHVTFGQQSFEFNKIPPLFVNQGQILDIEIKGVQSKLTLTRIREDIADKNIRIVNNHLIYEPTLTEYFDFLIGIKDGEIVDTVLISPSSDLSSEYEFIQNHQPLSTPASTSFIDITVTKDREEREWNHRQQRTREVSIVGKNITIDTDEGNRVYTAIKQNYKDKFCNIDILKFSISCDTLILKTKLWIPSAEVNINCRTLVFDRVNNDDGSFSVNGYINTKPIDFPSGKSAEEISINGENGRKGGNVNISVREIVKLTSDSILLCSDGGNGQDGGPGKDGVNRNNDNIGQNFTDMRGWFRLWPHCDQPNTIGKVIYGEYRSGQKIGSAKTVLLSGGNAMAPGHGGLGGEAGQISLTMSVPNGNGETSFCSSNLGQRGNIFGCSDSKCLDYKGGLGQEANWVTYDGPRTSFVIGDCSGLFGSCTRLNNVISYRVTKVNAPSGSSFPPPSPDIFRSWVHLKFLNKTVAAFIEANDLRNTDVKVEPLFAKSPPRTTTIGGITTSTMADEGPIGFADSFAVWARPSNSNNNHRRERIAQFTFDQDYIKKYSALDDKYFFSEFIYQDDYFDSIYSKNKPIICKASLTIDTLNKWLTPELVLKELDYVKDVYLTGNLEETAKLLVKLRDDVQLALTDTANPYYVNLSASLITINSMLNRVSANLDYFGNPAGFCPLLNLWVNKKLYENAIDESIATIILCRRIKLSQGSLSDQRNDLRTLLGKLTSQTAIHQKSLSDYNTIMVQSLSDAELIQNRITNLEARIKLLEGDLLKAAQSEVKRKYEVPAIKKVASVLATACKVIPVYQPVLGAIGTGIDYVNNLNTDDPLSNLENMPDIFTGLNDSAFREAKLNFDKKLAEFKKGEKSIIKYGKDLFNLYNTDYAPALQKIIDASRESKVDAREIHSKLEEIKAVIPEYGHLARSIDTLTEEKVSVLRNILENGNRIAAVQSDIILNLLQMDEIQQHIQTISNESLSPETMQLISSIEKRQFERLLEYQYYLQKSYEYRMLEAYPTPLSYEKEFNDLIRGIDNSNDSKEADKIAAVKMIYKSSTREVIDRYVKKMQNENFSYIKTPVTVSLTTSQLNDLNKNGLVTIDLSTAYNSFGLDNGQANRIIYGITLKNPVVSFANEKGNIVTSLSINNNYGYTSYGGKRYKFVFGTGSKPLYKTTLNTNPDNPATSSANDERYDVTEFLEITGLKLTEVNLSDKKLQSIFTNPLLETEITIEDKSFAKVTYTSLTFEIIYGYITQSGYNYIRVANKDNLLPKIVFKNLATQEIKIFKSNAEVIYKEGEKVLISAQPYFANLHFKKWIDHKGKTLSDTPELQITDKDFLLATPIYE